MIMTSPSLSSKQQELIQTFEALIAQHGIKVEIDPIEYDIQSPAALDIEHNECGEMVGIGIYDGRRAKYFTHITDTLFKSLLRLQLVAHNGVSDFECLRQWGIPIIEKQLVHDTMLVGHILDSSLKSYGLKDMSKRELGIEYPSYDDIVGKKPTKSRKNPYKQLADALQIKIKEKPDMRITLDKQPVELVAMYNAMDCFVTYKLYERQSKPSPTGKQISASTVRYFDQLEKPVAKIFAAMSNRGVRVNLDYLAGLKETLESQQRPLKEAILNELGNINLNSPKQLLEALHAKEIYPTFKTKPSTDRRALELFKQNPIVSNLLAYSELETLLSSFVLPYLERGQEVVHPFFNQCGTRTGRPSCSNPNLLQIPRRTDNGKLVRRMFIPRDGMLMGDCDFGQIEPRVLAHLSKDEALCELFNSDVDFHQFTADKLGINRERAKILNLSVGYRATFKSVSSQLRCSDAEAQKEIDKWWNLFPMLRRWQDSLIYESKRSGFCTTLLGRRIRVDDLSNGNKWRREGAERQLINNVTQGSAAEIMKMAMIKINQNIDLSRTFGLLVQVYDELLFESSYIANDSWNIKYDMENAIKLDVSLVVDCKTGNNWAECH